MSLDRKKVFKRKVKALSYKLYKLKEQIKKKIQCIKNKGVDRQHNPKDLGVLLMGPGTIQKGQDAL